MTLRKVFCTSRHPIDLSNGAVLGPTEYADNIDVDHPHNAQLIADGHITVVALPSTTSSSIPIHVSDDGTQGGIENA